MMGFQGRTDGSKYHHNHQQQCTVFHTKLEQTKETGFKATVSTNTRMSIDMIYGLGIKSMRLFTNLLRLHDCCTYIRLGTHAKKIGIFIGSISFHLLLDTAIDIDVPFTLRSGWFST